MKKQLSLLLASLALILTGCLVTSVYPFYMEKDVASEPALLGKWRDVKSAEERWVFESATNGYRLTYSSNDQTNVMQATFFKLHDQGFLDLFNPSADDKTQPPPIPSHFLFRVVQLKPTLKLSAMDYDWLGKMLEQHPQALRHHLIQIPDETEKKRLILTADTTELQRFILKHLQTKEAWQEPTELRPDTGTAASASEKK